MNVSGDNVLWVIGAGATCATLVFYGAFYLGQIWNQLKVLRQDVDKHDAELADLRQRRGVSV